MNSKLNAINAKYHFPNMEDLLPKIISFIYRDTYYILFLLSAMLFNCESSKPPEKANKLPEVDDMFFNHLADIQFTRQKSLAGELRYDQALQHLIDMADSALARPTRSVMDKTKLPPSGDKHDYMSVGPYWWPNPDTEDGLPYIRKDGEVNPERYAFPDAENFKNLALGSRDLLYAYYFTGEEAYAQKAAEMINTWFIADSTRMNPHLNYSQAIPGINEGRFIGIIDVNMIINIIEVLPILNASPFWSSGQEEKLRDWLESFLDWLLESEFGKQESIHPNNHGTWYDVTTISIAKYLGKKDLAYKMLNESKDKRFNHHLASDGSQPHELSRTRSVTYSAFNLKGLMSLALLAEDLGIDLWKYESKSGAKLEKALDFLKIYLDNPDDWSYEQISPESGQRMTQAFLLGGIKYGRPDLYQIGTDLYNQVGDYFGHTQLTFVPESKLLEQSRIVDYSDLKLSQLYELTKDRAEIPRSYYPDKNEVRWRPVKDWTSGFFAGSLWYQYALTNNDEWKRAAISETKKVSPQQYYKGSHDVGFQVMSSYGLGLAFAEMEGYDTVILNTSQSLASRFNPKVGAIKSWDWGDTDSYRVIIDNMINLELLFKATELSGDSSFFNIAVSHADKTLKHHFREDFSTYHVLEYDTITGQPTVKRTHQGYSDSSAWSRGQGWALYGFTMCYQYTQDEKYLAQAQAIADYLLNHPRMPYDGIPYWDFDHPDIPNTYLDVSAAAIYASALLKLAEYTLDSLAKEYHHTAERILVSMFQNHQAPENVPFLLDHSVGDLPQGHEMNVPLNYTDFYFLEAVYRYKNLRL